MEWFLIYMFVMVEKFSAALELGWGAFWGGSFLFGLVLMVACMVGADNKVEVSEQMKKPIFNSLARVAKWAIVLGFIAGMLSHFIPSQKDLAIIVGSGVTYKAVTSETGKRLGGKAIELLEKKLDDAMGSPVESKPQAETPPKAPATKGQAL